MAMAITVTTVVVVANAEANRTNVYADNCCVGRRGQKSKCKDRRNKRFHKGQLSVGSAASSTHLAAGAILHSANDRERFPRMRERRSGGIAVPVMPFAMSALGQQRTFC
jgi:hypothetical protein